MLKLNNTVEGTLIKRYKRFFSDVLLDTGEVVTAHTPNTGPMTTCWEKGMRCVLSLNEDPKRKLKYTLQLTYNGSSYILVNTHLPNQIVKEALWKKQLAPFANYQTLIPEYKIGNSRFDFFLKTEEGNKLIEVKNVSTIDVDNRAIFPDTRSERALKHVLELTRLQKEGYETYLLFLVSREDCDMFRPAGEIMPDYLKACQEAQAQGVQLLAYQCRVSAQEISIYRSLPVDLT